MNSSKKRPHISVMLQECLRYFEGLDLRVFLEGSTGAGGHSKALLEAHPEIQIYFACDRDPQALALAHETLAPWKKKVRFVHTDFADLDVCLDEEKIEGVDGFFLTWGSRRCS